MVNITKSWVPWFHDNKTFCNLIPLTIPALFQLLFMSNFSVKQNPTLSSQLCAFAHVVLSFFECPVFLLNNSFSSVNMFTLHSHPIWSHFCLCTYIAAMLWWYICLIDWVLSHLTSGPECHKVGAEHIVDSFSSIISSSSSITGLVSYILRVFLVHPSHLCWNGNLAHPWWHHLSQSSPIYFLTSIGSQKWSGILLGHHLLLQSHVGQKLFSVFEAHSIKVFCSPPFVPEATNQLLGH